MIVVDESIDGNHIEKIKEKEGNDKVKDVKRDRASGGSKIEEMTQVGIGRLKVSNNLPKTSVNLKSSVGLSGCVVNIAKFVFSAFFSLMIEKSGINWVLRSFGLALKSLSLNTKGEKRKHSEVDTENSDDEDNDVLGMEIKRWRPDHVYEAINEFVKKMWGEKDTNENIKDVDAQENDENMNSFASANVGKWNKKPDINFVSNKIIEIKTVEAENLIRDLTPKKTTWKEVNAEGLSEDKVKSNEERKIAIVLTQTSGTEIVEVEPKKSSEESVNKDLLGHDKESIETSTPLVENKIPAVFVFSGEKSDVSNDAEDIVPEDEQSMLSLMTFGEKQKYFAQQIKDQEAAAMKSAQKKSPLLAGLKSPIPKFVAEETEN